MIKLAILTLGFVVVFIIGYVAGWRDAGEA